MKKILAFLLAATMIMSLAACGTKKEEPIPSTENTEEQVSGGWTMNTVFGECSNIPKEAKEAFDKATADLSGAKHEAIAYLGSQVVTGTNYAFLCKTADVTPDAEERLTIAKVTVALDESVTLEITDLAMEDVIGDGMDTEINAEEITGGWTVEDACGPGLSEDLEVAFNKAIEGLAGVNYVPLACLGSQVVSGTNSAILCKATTVTQNPTSYLAVVTLYSDLNGGAEIIAVKGFNFTK